MDRAKAMLDALQAIVDFDGVDAVEWALAGLAGDLSERVQPDAAIQADKGLAAAIRATRGDRFYVEDGIGYFPVPEWRRAVNHDADWPYAGEAPAGWRNAVAVLALPGFRDAPGGAWRKHGKCWFRVRVGAVLPPQMVDAYGRVWAKGRPWAEPLMVQAWALMRVGALYDVQRHGTPPDRDPRNVLYSVLLRWREERADVVATDGTVLLSQMAATVEKRRPGGTRAGLEGRQWLLPREAAATLGRLPKSFQPWLERTAAVFRDPEKEDTAWGLFWGVDAGYDGIRSVDVADREWAALWVAPNGDTYPNVGAVVKRGRKKDGRLEGWVVRRKDVLAFLDRGDRFAEKGDTVMGSLAPSMWFQDGRLHMADYVVELRKAVDAVSVPAQRATVPRAAVWASGGLVMPLVFGTTSRPENETPCFLASRWRRMLAGCGPSALVFIADAGRTSPWIVTADLGALRREAENGG